MKRLVWGAVLFLIATGSSLSTVKACEWKPRMAELRPAMLVVNDGENTVWISSDEDMVTVVVFDNAERKSEWM